MPTTYIQPTEHSHPAADPRNRSMLQSHEVFSCVALCCSSLGARLCVFYYVEGLSRQGPVLDRSPSRRAQAPDAVSSHDLVPGPG
jgi:hypothetical protein